MSVLQEIVQDTRRLVAERREAVPAAELARAGAHRVSSGDQRSLVDALAKPGLSVIAEHKRRSPSAGVIREDLELADVVSAYERGGAAAVSVLTEESRFGGRLDDLGEARKACRLPILRKDFVVEDYQLHEALAAGADAVLLIVAALEPDGLEQLYALAGKLGLDALVEVHDEVELVVALELEPAIVGINNRNLATLEVDLGVTLALAPQIPEGTLIVAESGLRRPEELEQVAAAGVDAVLVGEALMRADDIEAACRVFTGLS